MKLLMMLLMAAVTYLTACSSNDKVKESIPGTYVRNIHTKVSTLQDTIMIWHEGQSVYHVLYKQSQRRLGGKLQISRSHKRETWMAIYLPDKQILVEKQHGIVLTVNLEKHLLLVNGQAFRRMDE